VRRGIDVFAQDQSVLERKQIDAVPLESSSASVGRRRGPFVDDEPVAHVQTPSAKAQVRPVLEDPLDVRGDIVALHALAGGVVLENHSRGVQSDDRRYVVGVPRLVVALDHSLELGWVVALVHAASIAPHVDIDKHRYKH
jgi:hypothetical protein